MSHVELFEMDASKDNKPNTLAKEIREENIYIYGTNKKSKLRNQTKAKAKQSKSRSKSKSTSSTKQEVDGKEEVKGGKKGLHDNSADRGEKHSNNR